MEERKAEERFEVAVRYLCERWGCFDFRQRNPGSTLFPPDTDLDDRVRLLKSDIDRRGAVNAIKLRLRDERNDDVSLELAAHNRLDLTVESLALRPAWNFLFDETERRTAAERLLRLISLASPGEISLPSGEDLILAVDWLNHRIISWETDPELPNSEVPYGPASQVEPAVRTWCESVAGTGRAFDEIGLIRTSLKQCDHYFGCSQCAQIWPRLYEPFRQFQQTTINTCCAVLKVLRVCVDRAYEHKKRGGVVGTNDEFAWRAIVCAESAGYNQSVREVDGILSEIESGGVFGPVLHSALSCLDPDDMHALSLVEAASGPFIELQWSLYDDDELIYLPSDGDLSEVPGAVVILNSTQVAEWKRLMTGSDLVFERRSRDGGQGTHPVDGDGLLWVLYWAAAFRAQKRTNALASTAEKIRQRAHRLWAERTRSGVPGSAEQDWASAEREVLREEDRPTPEPERAGLSLPSSVSVAAIQSLSDRIAGLEDLIASNSAAQLPIIGTLQDLVTRMDSPPRDRAEKSLRQALGDVVYNSLDGAARDIAIEAEHYWLDPNAPDRSRVVAELAKAFEHQLRKKVFEPFCKSLTASHVRYYPERLSVPQRSSADFPPGSRPGQPVPLDATLPKLLVNGQMKYMTLGAMAILLARPLPTFSKFLEQQRIDTERLGKILPDVTCERNRAVHEVAPWGRNEVGEIRDRWLGQTDGSPNIFAAIMPGEPRPSSS